MVITHSFPPQTSECVNRRAPDHSEKRDLGRHRTLGMQIIFTSRSILEILDLQPLALLPLH